MRRPGVGRERKPWRIKEYLDGLGLNQAMVAQELGITRAVVTDTVQGRKNNRKVLKRLLELGCPARYLDLPDDLKRQEAA